MMTFSELILRVVGLSMVCGILGYMVFVLLMWFIAMAQVGAWIFGLLGEGWTGG